MIYKNFNYLSCSDWRPIICTQENFYSGLFFKQLQVILSPVIEFADKVNALNNNINKKNTEVRKIWKRNEIFEYPMHRLEQAFYDGLIERGIDLGWIREFKFHPIVEWRFDFALK